MRALTFLLILLFNSPYIFAQSQPVSIEAYGKLPHKSMMVISPNVERMAYRDTSNNRDVMIIIDLITGSLLGAVDVSEVKPNSVYFIDNDRLIFVVSNNRRIYGYKGRHIVSAAYAYNLNSQKIHQLLVAGLGIYKGQTQLGRIIGVSPDNKFAYMPAYKNLGSYNLYKVNLDKQRQPTIYRKGTSDTIDFFLDKDGEVLARERYNNKNNLHSIEALIEDDWKVIYREETPYRTKSFNGLTPDRKSLVMVSQSKKHGRWAYYTMSLADGSILGPMFSHNNKDVENILTDLQRVVHGVQYSGFTDTYDFFDEKLNARMRGLKKALPKNTFKISDYTPDWKSIVFYMEGNRSSGDYVLYQNGALNMLTSVRPDIPAEAVHPTIEYNYNARDGLNIPTLITSPKGVTAKNLPAIMLPHGGPESYNKLGFDWLTQYFANQGYLVIQPQFRGSKGFGSEHLHKGRGEWGRKMQDDLTDAIENLSQAGLINKKRICIVGASYGGYAALAGATFTPDLYKCVISINGVSDIEQMLRTEQRNYGSDHWVVSYWQDVISKGDVKEDHLEKISPINYVNDITAPVLLIHGERDLVVPLRQSQDMYDELDDANKNVTFIELEKGDHYLSHPKNRLKALKTIDEFIKKYI